MAIKILIIDTDQDGLLSEWSFIRWSLSLIRVISHQSDLWSGWSLSLREVLIRVTVDQCGLPVSSGRSFSFTRVVSHRGGLSV